MNANDQTTPIPKRGMSVSPMLLLFLLLFISNAHSADVTVTFKVTIPQSTLPDAKIFISGDLPALGSWNGAGVELKKIDNRYEAAVSLPKDQPIEFKFTRGSWETVEKNADGGERANRTLKPSADQTVELTVARWADQSPTATTRASSTRTGDIRILSTHSKLLGNDRKLWIYLPPDYDKNADQRYPVFYMHDGQNLFDASTSFAGEWNADETAQALILSHKIQPIIIVGIENTRDRMTEYTPGERGTLYERFVVEEVKPLVDSGFRTSHDRTRTAIGGSSLGGLISLYIAQKHPQDFGLCCAMSPSLWWNHQAAMKDLANPSGWMKQTRFWIDTGAAEGTEPQAQVDLVRTFGKTLEQNGLARDHDFRISIVEGAKHNEAAWSKRFGQVLQFFFPAGDALQSSGS